MEDYYSKGMVDFIIILLISSLPLLLLSILSGQLAKSPGRPSLIRYERVKDS